MYFRIEQNEDKNYLLKMTNKFYELCQPYFNNSYYNILFRLFNLLPQDFYHYVGAYYHAQFQKHKYLSSFVQMSFTKEQDAKNFCKECNSRLHYCVQRGDFK